MIDKKQTYKGAGRGKGQGAPCPLPLPMRASQSVAASLATTKTSYTVAGSTSKETKPMITYIYANPKHAAYAVHHLIRNGYVATANASAVTANASAVTMGNLQTLASAKLG